MTRRRVPGMRDPRQVRAALRGLDGGMQLRAALDAVRARTPGAFDLVCVDNGRHGPGVIDTRAKAPGAWIADGLIPTGAVVALADLDDPSPRSLLANGFDVVVLLETRGAAVVGVPVRVGVHFHDRLGLPPPHPFWVQLTRDGSFARAEVAA